MKRYLTSVFLGFIAMLSWTNGSAIADIVPVGSTFNAAMVESNGAKGLTIQAPITFNGIPQTFTGFANVPVTVTESQANLGGGRYEIDISFASSPGHDLFAATGNGTGAFIGIGGRPGFQDPLDLTEPFDLTSAVLTFTQGNRNVFESDETINLVVHPKPWDGFYGGSNEVIGFVPAVGEDVERADLILEGTVAAPLPPARFGVAALVALITARAAVRRRMRLREIGVQSARSDF